MDQRTKQIILLADDCPETLRLHQSILVKEGYEVVLAKDGKETIELACSLRPDVIVMDCLMPHMNGLQATSALRASPLTAAIPIIMVSAKTEEQDITAGLAAGADEYLFKPLRSKEFCLRVRSMARLRNYHLQIQRAHEGLQRQTEAMTTLRGFHEAILADSSPETICRLVVETAAELAHSNRVSLLVPDATNQSLRFAHAVGLDESVWRELTVPLSSPVAGKVFATQCEIIVNQDTPRLPAMGQYESCFFMSIPLLSTPLRAASGTVGVLNVTEKHNHDSYHPVEIQALRQLAQTAAFALENTSTRQKLDQTRDSIIFSMARLSEHRHPETGQHLERVRDLSVLLARYLANDQRISEPVDQQFITDLGRAAPLHDIGKVAIPDLILRKPGKLTETEFRTMQDHTWIGAETLRSVMAKGHETSFLKMATDIAHYHHERFDGTGYPVGLAGDAIPLSARIVCLADSYDAIRTEREYKPTRSHHDATDEILRARDKQFDPRLVDAYCSLAEEFAKTYQELAEGQLPLPADLSRPPLAVALA